MKCFLSSGTIQRERKKEVKEVLLLSIVGLSSRGMFSLLGSKEPSKENKLRTKLEKTSLRPIAFWW